MADAQPYWTLAEQYVLADNNFASNIDSSFAANQYLIAGWANHAANFPKGNSWGCDNPNETPTLTKSRTFGKLEPACFDSPTLATELEKVGLDWRYYAVAQGYGGPDGYFWSAFDAINAVRNGPEWTTGSNPKVISPPQQALSDIAAGNVPNGVVWIAPWLSWSDAPSAGSGGGPAWVAAVVNAIGSNTEVWDSSAIFVVWAGWGGWYDHIPPRPVDYDGLGFRVPMLVISPYAKQGYVTHQQYEFGSVVRFVEDNFGLPYVTPNNCCYGELGSDRRAIDPRSDVFDFSQTPRPFSPIQVERSVRTRGR
jgi:phospholipase C